MFSSSSLSITLQNDTLYTSPYLGLDEQQMSLRGIVTLDSNTVLKVKRIHLQFSGKLSMQFPGAITKTRRDITDLTVTLLEHQKATSVSGKHVFPFEILVPNDLPESFRGDFGKIKYTLKAIVETSFIGSGLKSKVPIYIQRNADLLEEIPSEHTTQESQPDKIACKVTLPTTKYTPGEKFDVQVSAMALDQQIRVTSVTAILKQYAHFQIPSKSDQTRVSVAEYTKHLGATTSPLNSDEHTKTLLMKIPENTILHCINPLVEVTHNLIVRFEWETEDGKQEYTTLTVPIEVVASVGGSELDQLPVYCSIELPPSYATSTHSSVEAVPVSLPPSYSLSDN